MTTLQLVTTIGIAVAILGSFITLECVRISNRCRKFIRITELVYMLLLEQKDITKDILCTRIKQAEHLYHGGDETDTE